MSQTLLKSAILNFGIVSGVNRNRIDPSDLIKSQPGKGIAYGVLYRLAALPQPSHVFFQ